MFTPKAKNKNPVLLLSLLALYFSPSYSNSTAATKIIIKSSCGSEKWYAIAAFTHGSLYESL